MTPSFRLLILTAFLGLAGSGCAGAAGAGHSLSAKAPVVAAATAPEREALGRGEVVTRPLEFERGEEQYVGGIAMGLVPAQPEDVLGALEDAGSLAALLPRTKRVTLVELGPDARRVELVQGNSLVEATYTVRIVPEGRPGRLAFRLDRSRPHDIDDVYGYFQVERFDDHRSLVTVAAAVDVGSGLTHLLFARKVQDVILSTPYVMRDYFASSGPRDRSGLIARLEPR